MNRWRSADPGRARRPLHWRAAVALAALAALVWVFGIERPFAAPQVDTCQSGTAVEDPADHPELVADCEALLALKDQLAGTATLNWSASLVITSWDGVYVSQGTSTEPRRVKILLLSGQGLDGALPAGLGRLTALGKLNFSANDLSGRIPAALGQLTALTHLRLSDNDLSGAIPAELGQLTGLVNLELADNDLGGAIPAALGRLTSLVVLELGGNLLTGEIPAALAEIGASLQRLNLDGRSPLPAGAGLNGKIPPQLGNLSGLSTLSLQHNRLSGPLPTRLGRLSELVTLRLQGNQLSGPVPTQLGSLTKLDQLGLAGNQLSGAIPTQLLDLSVLRQLYLSDNPLTGCEPAGLRSRVLFNDLSLLNLETCPANQSPTAETPQPTYTVTVAAGASGAIAPDDDAEYAEASEVTLTASWNDATHTFAGWSGDCDGSETTCTLVMYDDYTVEATFDPLPADRCAAPSTWAPPETTPRSRTSLSSCCSARTPTAATRSRVDSRSPWSPPPPCQPAMIASCATSDPSLTSVRSRICNWSPRSVPRTR